MTLSEATAIVTRIIGKEIRYAPFLRVCVGRAGFSTSIIGKETRYASIAAKSHTDDYRNFTIVSVDKIACALKTGEWYVVANVIDHDDADLEKVRSLHIAGIM